MTIPTVALTGTIYDDTGAAVVGATVTAQLSATDVYQSQNVYAVAQSTTTDANGVFTLNLFPNTLGQNNTFYKIKAQDPTSLKNYINGRIIVPDVASNLDSLYDARPSTPQNSGLNGVQAIPFLSQDAMWWSTIKNSITKSRTYAMPDLSGTVMVFGASYQFVANENFSGYINVMGQDGLIYRAMVCQ